MPVWVCLSFLAISAAAQTDAPSEGASSDEIIVTGERASRTLRETPSSVVVLTPDDLESDADRLDSVLEQIPNIQFGSGGQGPTIRGQDSTGVLQDLPAFLGGSRPRVAVQIDGRAISYNEFVNGATPMWDVERVEVFRSPQSTTQGRNSIAGAIFVHTADPTYEWEGKARLIHAGLDIWQGSAAVSGPIVDGQLAFRLSGDARTSRNPNKVVDSLIAGANPNRAKYGIVRGKLLAEPMALPGFRIETSFVHKESRQPPAEGIVPPFEERHGSRGAAVSDTKVDSLTTVATYKIADRLTLTSTLSAGWIENERFAIRGLGETLTDVRDRSIELLLDWRSSEQAKMRFGVHRLQTRLDQSIDLTAVFGLGEFVDHQRSLGLFGEVELKPLPRVTFTAGLRLQRDRQDRQGQLGNPFFPTIVDFDRTFEAWLPKLTLSYDISEKVTAGLLVQRAYNPGGIAINFDTARQEDFGQESLWSYELFARAMLLKDRLWLSANLFRNDFRNAQRAEQRAFRLPGGQPAFWFLIYNIPTARSEGMEFAADWQATGRLRLRGGLGLLRTRIDDDGPMPFAGKEFARAPNVSASGSIEWRPIGRLRLNADVRHSSGYFSNDLNTPAFRIDKRTVVNARAAYDLGAITLSAYVRNLFDRFYLTSQFSALFATAGDPREFGVGMETRF